MSHRLIFVRRRLTFMSRRLVFVTHRVMFMSRRIVFVMRRVQSVHTTNSERTLGQLGLGNSTSFVISMYLFTIFHYTIGPFRSISENFTKS